jgi:hypothetical protein
VQEGLQVHDVDFEGLQSIDVADPEAATLLAAACLCTARASAYLQLISEFELEIASSVRLRRLDGDEE